MALKGPIWHDPTTLGPEPTPPAQTHSEELFARLDQLTNLLTHADELYATCANEGRELLNRAVFEVFHVDSMRNNERLGTAVANAPLTPVFDAVVAVMPLGRHEKPPTGLNLSGVPT